MKEERYDKSIRLMSVNADPVKGRMWTGYAAYSDGSGSQTRCRLASSEAHAKEVALAWLYEEWKGEQSHTRISLALSAVKLGLPANEEVLSVARKAQADAFNAQLEHARKEFAKAKSNLEVIESKADSEQPA